MIRLFTSSRFFSHTIEPLLEPYDNYRIKQFQACKAVSSIYDSQYNKEGMKKFAEKHPNVRMKTLITPNSQVQGNLAVSNIGLGTYKGSLDSSDDLLQFNAIIDSILSGINVIDTCSNFRDGRSQTIIGTALRYLIQNKQYQRNQLFLMSKAGYVRQNLPSSLNKEIINGHCVHPTYLEQSLNQSLQSMRLKKLDVFYLNNFAECQLLTLGRDKFEKKLGQAFEFLQKSRQENKIANYGLASWQSFRLSPKNEKHLSLKRIVELAEKICGKNNGFKFIQVPMNIMMPQAFAQKYQELGSLLEAAEALKINVISSSPLLSGTLINIPMPANKLSCRHNGAKHLQLMRSTPSPSLVCTLIGQKSNRHVKKNMEVLEVPQLSEQQWFDIFVPSEKAGQKII